MFIKNVSIKNIGALSKLEINFPDELPGWHVLIGDNGSGKSTILKAIASVLIGPSQISALNIVWEDWLKKNEDTGEITIHIKPDWTFDKVGKGSPPKNKLIQNSFYLDVKRSQKFHFSTNQDQKSLSPLNYNWSNNDGWFSVAYGPFRRFTGGDEKRNRIFNSSPKAGAHLSLFGEDVALTEALSWLSDLDNKRLRKREELVQIPEVAELSEKINIDLKKNPSFLRKIKFLEQVYESFDRKRSLEMALDELNMDLTFPEGRILFHIKNFLNNTDLLPNNVQFKGFDVNGSIVFTDDQENEINVYQMSDGYRSILSLTFELIRQLIDVYGDQIVFDETFNETNLVINVPGVVLIDEIDVHLHPTWQVRIGDWFLKHFPKLQFILTTHSPLVCRASAKGSIWRLSNSENDNIVEEVKGLEKERLIYGNILDAYGTELFGDTPVRSNASNDKLNRLRELNMLFALNDISEEESDERNKLLKVLSTDDSTG